MTSYKYQNPKSFSCKVEYCVYTEYDKEKNKTFSCQLRHEQSVRITTDSLGNYQEWDNHNRCTFSTDKDNFWYLRFYDENPTNKTPYQVVHHSWHLYNGLKAKSRKRILTNITSKSATMEEEYKYIVDSFKKDKMMVPSELIHQLSNDGGKTISFKKVIIHWLRNRILRKK